MGTPRPGTLAVRGHAMSQGGELVLIRRAPLSIGLTAALVGTLAFAAPALAAARFSTQMTGAQEVPGPGDPDGSGRAIIKLNRGKSQVCYSLMVTGIAPAVAAHIHVGAAGLAGPVVVGLNAPNSGTSSGCVTVDPALLSDIARNPENYYVNVHNQEYPAGAVRGQLG